MKLKLKLLSRDKAAPVSAVFVACLFLANGPAVNIAELGACRVASWCDAFPLLRGKSGSGLSRLIPAEDQPVFSWPERRWVLLTFITVACRSS